MFGIFRTLLASFVVIGHLFGPYQLGTYAVFGFYVLSGFLMTAIMHETYGYSFSGKKRYLINRFLRIYPTYWFAILLSLTLLFLYGSDITDFKSSIYIPKSSKEWIQNVFILLSHNSAPRLSPATWALTVEIFFYVAICFGISKTKQRTLFWLVLSLIYTICLLLAKPQDSAARYFPIQAASLPFSIGSIVYHNKENFIAYLEKWCLHRPLILFFFVCLNFCTAFAVESKLGISLIYTVGSYINLVLMTLCIVSLIETRLPLGIKKIDKRIGNISYPVYLLHWQAGAFLYAIIFKDFARGFMTFGGLLFLLSSSIVVVGCSLFVYLLIDKKIEKIRVRIKMDKMLDINRSHLILKDLSL
jgi:peptidoglycan/LPS O-acetylase OafA/YrhL